MKKLAIALLALCMVLTTVLVPILADPEETVVGFSSARVKKADLTEVKNIKDYDDKNVDPAYKITDAEGLVKLSELVNGGQSFEGCFIYLAKDINMADVDFTPIGMPEFTATMSPDDPTKVTAQTFEKRHEFKGTFNGHGHVIDNLVIESAVNEFCFVGLFAETWNATVCNLILGENCSFTQTGYSDWSGVGAVTGRSNNTTFDNIYNLADCTTTSSHAAGIFGRGSGTIRNSTNCGDMSATRSTGGFTGFCEATITVENCRNAGTINGSNASAFVSRVRSPKTVITGCINNGEVIGTDRAGVFGGYGDQVNVNLTLTDCINYGAYSSTAEGGGKVDPYIVCAKSEEEQTTKPTITNCQDLYNAETPVEDPTLALETVTPNYEAEEDGAGEETAFVTTEPPYQAEIGVNTNPTGDEIGYSSARIEEVDTTKIVNILNYDERPYEDFYKVTDVEGLQKLDSQLYNYTTFSGVTIYLANDIDMSKVSGFQPISYDIEHVKQVNGSPRFYFAGTLDGQGEAICNLKMLSREEPLKFNDEGEVDPENGKPVSEALVCVGLFGVTGEITIKNLILDETCEFGYTGTAANPCVAALVAKSTGSIHVDNVWNRASISGGRFIGAVSGRPSGRYEVKNMTNSGDILGAGCVGGFFGFDAAGGLIENCRNVGDIKRVGGGDAFHSNSAGFVSRAVATVTLKNCINNGNIEGPANVGAFLGTIHNGNTLEDCINYGTLLATSLKDSTGIEFATHATKTDAEGNVTNLGECSVKNVLNKAGEQDPTLMYEQYVPDFTREPDGDIPEYSETEATTKVTSTTKLKTTAGGNNGVSTTVKTTADNNVDDEPIDKEKGCSSTVIGGVAVIMLVCGAAVTLFKKKED